jgi:PAS domain S-box-containing protein
MNTRVGPFARRPAGSSALPSHERERLATQVVALLMVAMIAILKAVTGLTGHSEPFTFYAIAVGAAAARGGAGPAVVAALASMVAAPLGAPAPIDAVARALFTIESLGLATVVCWVRAGVQSAQRRAASAHITIAHLQTRNQQGRLLDAGLRHVEDTAVNTALIALNAAGVIVEWRSSAERLFGYSSEQAIGMSASVLLSESGPLDDLLERAWECGTVNGSGVCRRCDGRQIDTAFELRRYRDIDVHGYTFTVTDMAPRREWDAYRDAAVRAQRVLQNAADETKEQLAALESIIDPSLNPRDGLAAVEELLERLRMTIGADGAALVQDGRGARAIASGGLQPSAPTSVRGESRCLSAGRVTLVHNDRERVAHTAGIEWPGEVSSLMVVPIAGLAEAWSRIEVVSARPKRSTDWDVALARVAADRLTGFVAQECVFVKPR